MIDFHTHSIFSDGQLSPAELIQRARKKGYKGLAITDHADSSNLEHIIVNMVRVCADTNVVYKDIYCIPGIELTHVPPALIGKLIIQARKLGAKMVVVHGETIFEPVEPGTNHAAIAAGADILAHPGFITLEDAKLAAKKGVHLEITAKPGHGYTNGHVAKMALKAGAKMMFGTDTHAPDNLVDDKRREEILYGAGLDAAAVKRIIENAQAKLEMLKKGGKKK